jgi:hypothetical protein
MRRISFNEGCSVHTIQRMWVTIFLFSMSGALYATVYETRDASGQLVFSDVPRQGSVRVDMPETNIADTPSSAAEPRSGSDTPIAAEAAAVSIPAEEGMRVYNKDERMRTPDWDHRVDHSEQRHEVGDEEDESRHEVGDDDLHRHEVGDHLAEHSHPGGNESHDHAVEGFIEDGEVEQRHIVIHH